MRRPDQHEPRSFGSTLTPWLPVITAMAIMVTGCVSTFLVLQLDEFRPNVGDIVVFKAGSQDAESWEMMIRATFVPAAGASRHDCTLDPNVMAEAGGSLVVEGRREDPELSYRVHWAGSQTAQRTGNCGKAADIMVSRTDLQRLANAAGGFGVANKSGVR